MSAQAAAAQRRPGLASLRPLSLRAKAMLAIAAVVVYFLGAFTVLSIQRSKMITIVEDLDGLHQVSATLSRVNMFASQTVLKMNASLAGADPGQTVESIELNVESISAGVGGLAAWYPRAGEMMQRLETALSLARRDPGEASLAQLRATLSELAAELDQLSREVRARHERMWAGYLEAYDGVTLATAILFLLGIAVFGGIAMVFFRRLAWDLQALSGRAVEVVRGYRGELLRITRSDEVGALMDSVNRMQHILREREQQIEVARQQRFHQEKMVAIGSLAAAVAHEINNPIAAIEGVAQSIRSARQDRCPHLEVDCHPELILEHTRRIVGITRQLSELSAPQSTQPEWTDLNALARSTCTFVSYDPRFRAVRMDLALDPSIPAAWAVGDHLTQVLMNLLINAADALKACPPGERRIAVSTRRAGEFIELEVADNGPGMPADVAARAFDEGFTTKETGSGIGLFMCKTLVERGGGTIALASEPGGGTRLAMTVPTREMP